MTDAPAARPTFEQIAINDPRINALLDALRKTHVNGGVAFAGFAVHGIGYRHQWYLCHRKGFVLHAAAFIESPAVRAALPELRLGESAPEEPAWYYSGPYTLDGELTETLLDSGSYGRYAGPPKEMKRLAEAFCDALFGDRYLSVQIFRSNKCWTPWFVGEIWDRSWLILDLFQDRVWLLCVTDED
jgi:hypothetical protein